MGLGFTLALVMLSSVREIIGTGCWFGMQIMPEGYQPMAIATSPSGGFLFLGLLLLAVNAFVQYTERRKAEKEEEIL